MNQTIQHIDAYLAFLVVLINFVFAIHIVVRTPRTILDTLFLPRRGGGERQRVLKEKGRAAEG